MILRIQIYSLLFSFFYGIFVFFLLELNYKLLYTGKMLYKIIISFLFVMFISLLYFYGLLKINNGIIHIYFLIVMFTGYMLSFVIYRKKAKLIILLFFIIFGGIIGSLSYSFFSNVNKIVSIKKEKQVLNDRIAELTDEEKVLNSDIKKLEDPEYVARYAREKYLYSKDGELIIRIPDEDN